MVPETRDPFSQPTPAAGKGVLDMFSRQAAAHTTLVRGQPNAMDPMASTAGVYGYGGQPLFVPSAAAQRNPIKDFLPMTRLEKLTTNQSNVFAVYLTVGLFEVQVNPATGEERIGIEYGADRGKAERFRAFYVIDRSKPVGYQVGVDHNVENTVLIRRYLNTHE